MHVRDKDGAAERNERKKDSLFGDSKGVVNESLHDISEFEIFLSKFGFRLFSFFALFFFWLSSKTERKCSETNPIPIFRSREWDDAMQSRKVDADS